MALLAYPKPMKSVVLFGFLGFSFFLVACSNSQVNPLLGDYQSSCASSSATTEGSKSTTSTNCSTSNITYPSFERYDNSDVIINKLDKTVELSGRCDVKENPDSKITLTLTAQGYSAKVLTSGYVPLVGVTAYGQNSAVAKCEKGKWAIAINACANGMQYVGVHRVDLVLSAVDSNSRAVTIADGSISAIINRTEACP